ncbi:hypothetical protein ACFFHM_24965 [Halalkalibacter kiskunsagensis]|uniref:EAL domain-containing protein n=1 Tax=Halalkalibacter kiskunsagensis TaxID=1548599 RepID=A0ABV6KPD6_9BACI
MSYTIPTSLCLEQILPYFQPIIGADQHSVVGYEILGRYKLRGSILKMIPYTNNYDQYIARILPLLPAHCFRIYVCNRIGNQLSGTHIKQMLPG